MRIRKENFELTCPFSAYLHAVCRNLWLTELKKRQRQEVTKQAVAISIDKQAEELALDTQLDQQRDRFFWQKLSSLGPSCQDIIKLAWKGLGMKEVAAQLNISYQYARKKKSECMGRLMKLVQEDPAYALLKY